MTPTTPTRTIPAAPPEARLPCSAVAAYAEFGDPNVPLPPIATRLPTPVAPLRSRGRGSYRGPSSLLMALALLGPGCISQKEYGAFVSSVRQHETARQAEVEAYEAQDTALSEQSRTNRKHEEADFEASLEAAEIRAGLRKADPAPVSSGS